MGGVNISKEVVIPVGVVYKMVCSQDGLEKMLKIKKTGIEKKKKKSEKRDIMEQYRKLRLVLPNIKSRGKISKQSVVEEAILYIEELQRQLRNRLEETEEFGKHQRLKEELSSFCFSGNEM